jgi:hypothetical protein
MSFVAHTSIKAIIKFGTEKSVNSPVGPKKEKHFADTYFLRKEYKYKYLYIHRCVHRKKREH